MTKMEIELLGPQEIADLLNVKLRTVHMWKHRGILPEPFTLVSGRPAWRANTILGWAISTGRDKQKPSEEG